MNSRKILLGLALAGLLGLVLWQINRHNPPAITRSAPSVRPADEPYPATPADAGQPAAPAVATAAPALAPVAAPVIPGSPATPAVAFVQTSGPVAPPPVAAPAPQPSTPAPAAELAATARMYAAHAALRAPEVADPDSAANKQILGTMVTKLLAKSPVPPPAMASSPAP